MGPKVVACNMRSSDVKAAPETENKGGDITVDSELSASSENPVQNKVIYEALNDAIYLSAANDDYTPTTNINLNNSIIQSNTKNGYTTLSISARLAKSGNVGNEMKIIDIPDSTKDIIGRTFVQTIGMCGNTMCNIVLNTYGDSSYISFYPAANVQSGATLIVALMTFPVTL